MALYARGKRECSDLLTAFELILRSGIEIAVTARPDLEEPLSRPYPVYALIEAAAGGRVDLGIMEDFLAAAGDLVEDGIVAPSRTRSAGCGSIVKSWSRLQGRGGRYLAHRCFRADLQPFCLCRRRPC